jgi:putative aldouronate transport system substrate-binding protein
VEAVPYPTLEKGETPKFGNSGNLFGGNGATISMNCDKKELAAKWLDYGYGEEGHMLYNFGIEGESYELVDGEPKYIADITDNQNGLSFAAALARYARSMGGGVMVTDRRYFDQYLQYPEQKYAVDTWVKAENTGYLPPIIPDNDSMKRYASIMNDVESYVAEYELKVILGTESIDNFDKYLERCESMGIEEAIQMQQAALKKYNER